MNQSKIEDAVNNISDRTVSEALDIDSAEKLREAAKPELKRSRMKLIRRVSALAACLCVCICAAALVVHFNKPSEGLVSVSSPVFQVDSAEEMVKYLGFSLPLQSGKTASEFYLYAYDDYAQFGEIVYTDGSKFRMSRSGGDISGIFGAVLDGAQELKDVTVYYYSIDGSRYAVWTYLGRACCYYAAPGETELIGSVTEIIENTK